MEMFVGVNRFRGSAVATCWWLYLLLPGLVLHARAPGPYLSPSLIVPDQAGEHLYVAGETANQIVVFDIGTGKVEKRFSLSASPTGIALSPDDARLYVTIASPQGRVYVLHTENGAVSGEIHVGHTPTAPVVDPDGKTLYVCNRFNHNVAVISLDTKRQVATIPVSREPIAAAISPDGATLLVANLLPDTAADAEYVAAVVDVIDTSSKEVVATIRLPNGSGSLRGICISPDGKHAYVAHILSRYRLPATQLERGWMNTNALSVIDVIGRKLISTVLLDNVDRGAANPWGVTCTPDGRFVCVTHAGSHEVSLIDRGALHDKLTKVSQGENVSGGSPLIDQVPNDLAFLVGLRRRVRLAGKGPRGAAVVGGRLYVAEYFSDSLGVVDLETESGRVAKSYPLGFERPMTPERRGEFLFHDASFCFQSWQSCSTCHPSARIDAFNWDLPNDGLGTPKNAKSMLLVHRTPPTTATGIRADAETSVRAGIRSFMAVLPESDAEAIDAYLKSLTPLPSPYLIEGRLSPAAQRGKGVFANAKCAYCHELPLYTDLKMYDIGTGKGREQGIKFDVPTLIEIWRTAPYLHDGRAKTLRDVVTTFNPHDAHGETSALSAQDIDDLVAYVRSL